MVQTGTKNVLLSTLAYERKRREERIACLSVIVRCLLFLEGKEIRENVCVEIE